MTTQFVKVAMEAKNDDYSQLQWKIVLQTTIVLTWLSSSTSIIRRKAFQKIPSASNLCQCMPPPSDSPWKSRQQEINLMLLHIP